MKPFLVLRVPVVLDENRDPLRRPRYASPATTIVAEAATEKDAADAVRDLGYGDRNHHYYAFELRYSGDPERKAAKAESAKAKKATTRPKLAVDNSKREKQA